MREALRYMVYGEGKTFDVDRVIDLLQALEKFVAVRDTGDGTAYKVDGVRGGVYVGQAGDVRGTNRLDADGDAKARSALDAYRAEGVVGVTEGFSDVGLAPAPAPSPPAAAPPPAQSAEDKTASTTREALGFFFSDDGQVFRDFLVEEVVAAADALSREALQTLILTAPGQALDRLPQPAFVRSFNREVRDALAPKPNESDEKALSSILTLTLTLTLTRTRTRTLTLTLTLTLTPTPTPTLTLHLTPTLTLTRSSRASEGCSTSSWTAAPASPRKPTRPPSSRAPTAPPCSARSCPTKRRSRAGAPSCPSCASTRARCAPSACRSSAALRSCRRVAPSASCAAASAPRRADARVVLLW